MGGQTPDSEKPGLLHAGSQSVSMALVWLYAVVVAVTGVVITVAGFYTSPGRNSIPASVLHVYMYGVSTLFLLYLFANLLARRPRSNQDGSMAGDTYEAGSIVAPEETSSLRPTSAPATPTVAPNGNTIMHADDEPDEPEGNLGDADATHCMQNLTSGRTSSVVAYNHEGQGVNIFLRLGAIVFSMGSVLLDGFRLLQSIETASGSPGQHCFDLVYIIHVVMRIFLIFCQTFFVFKNHKIVLRFQCRFMRWGLVHLMVTNLFIWFSTVFLEARESVAHQQTPATAKVLQPAVAYENISGLCHTKLTLADKASPFLYPFVVQACFVTVAIVYRINSNVGLAETVKPIVPVRALRGVGACHKSHAGLFIGLFLLAVAAVSACFSLLYHQGATSLDRSVSILVYAATHVFILLAALLHTITALCRMRNFTTTPTVNTLYQNLFFVTLFGHYLFLGFCMVPLSYKLHDISVTMSEKYNDFSKLMILKLAVIGVSFVQTLVQGVLIVYGLRLRASDRQQVSSKPGRSVLTVLMLASLALWLISTVEVQQIQQDMLYRVFYGNLAWSLISHVTFPLSTLFQFHSLVCLSSIWFNAYHVDFTSRDKKVPVYESQNFL